MMAIEMFPVKSSHIAAVGYSDEDKSLYVEFHSGQTYRYKGAKADHLEAMLKAESAGKFFHSQIRPNFEFEKVEKKDARK